MLQFEASSTHSLGTFTASEVYQLLDMSTIQPQIATGNCSVTATASFNRVLGDSQTDTRFRLELRAYAGLPSSFPSQLGNSELATEVVDLFSDGDISTWETINLPLLLPPSTDFLSLRIAVVEDIFNDAVSPEFDGHYADDVQIVLCPVPVELQSFWIE